MPSIIPGYITEQKVVTVSNNDSDINTELTTQGLDTWLATSFFANGSDITILFTRTIAAS